MFPLSITLKLIVTYIHTGFIELWQPKAGLKYINNCKSKGKADLFSAYWQTPQVWHALSTDLTVLLAHFAFVRNGMNHTCLCLPACKSTTDAASRQRLRSASRHRAKTPSHQVRPSGVFCCRPDSLELAARLSL